MVNDGSQDSRLNRVKLPAGEIRRWSLQAVRGKTEYIKSTASTEYGILQLKMFIFNNYHSAGSGLKSHKKTANTVVMNSLYSLFFELSHSTTGAKEQYS